ncbi:M67 family metallopeptidase [Chloroflexi bacterium TSY]|nr:M67 family metallopeptidase [Chloroflexi bacterium TSY]
MNQSTEAIQLPQTIYNEIIAHAREGKPEEICGILRGRDLEAVELIRGQNVAEERINNYEVDAQTLLLQFKFEDVGDEMMGIYHSHPVSVAYPSATDAWNAHYPDSFYLICSLEFDDQPVIRVYRMLTYWLDALTLANVTQLQQTNTFSEMRPNTAIYATYIGENENIPEILQVEKNHGAPLYFLYHEVKSEHEATIDEARVVTLHEYPIQIVP